MSTLADRYEAPMTPVEERLVSPFPPFADEKPAWIPGEGRLPEIHLYFGAFCNRECDFCVVFGSPQGWIAEVDEALLDGLLDLLHPQAQLKVYGGADHPHVAQNPKPFSLSAR